MSWGSFLLFLFLSLDGEGEGEEKRKRMRGIQRWGGVLSVGRKRKRERGGGDVMSEMASSPPVCKMEKLYGGKRVRILPLIEIYRSARQSP